MTAPALLPDTLLRADPPGSHVLVALDVFTALYHRRSGQTHLVSEPVPDLISRLEQSAMTPAQLLAALSEEADVSAEGDVLAALIDRLAELEALGLVVRA